MWNHISTLSENLLYLPPRLCVKNPPNRSPSGGAGGGFLITQLSVVVVQFLDGGHLLQGCLAIAAGGACAELVAGDVLLCAELLGALGSGAFDAHGEDGQVGDFDGNAIEGELLDAIDHVAQDAGDDASGVGRSVLGHVACEPVEVDGLVHYGLGIHLAVHQLVVRVYFVLTILQHSGLIFFKWLAVLVNGLFFLMVSGFS